MSFLILPAILLAEIEPVSKESKDSSGVNWETRFIISTGIGSPSADQNMPQAAQRAGALRVAQQVALRNALEMVKGIYMNSSTTVENFMMKSDVVTSRVGGFMKNFEQQGKPKYMSDGSVEVTMKIPLDGIGGLGESLYDESIGQNPSITTFSGKASSKETVFSGLIIDCKGLSIKPALSPRVLDESGQEVYGSAYVSREWAVKQGVVGYSKDIASAAKLDRLGDTPGKVKAVKASGDNSTDVVIADKDAADIRSAAKNLKFLSECRVVFVVD
jgi:hypothetical protein